MIRENKNIIPLKSKDLRSQPLFKSYSRDYVFPEETKSKDFQFGYKQEVQESLKEILQPKGDNHLTPV